MRGGNRVRHPIRHHWFEAAVCCGILLLIALSTITESFTIEGETLYASIIAYALALLIAAFSLSRQGVGIERLFFALASMTSGVWLYEIAYHYSYYYGASGLGHLLFGDLRYLTINTDGSQFPLIWSLLMVALPFSAFRHMRLNKLFLLAAGSSLVLFWIWIQVGYPQFFAPQWWPTFAPSIGLIPKAYSHTSNQLIVLYGYIFNSLTKVLAVVPSLLFYRANKEPSPKMGQNQHPQ